MSTIKHSSKSILIVALASCFTITMNAQFSEAYHAIASMKSKSMTSYAIAQHEAFYDMYDLMSTPKEAITRDANYVGGTQELMSYVQEKFEYPDEARQNGQEGKILAQFVVDADGSVSDVTIIQSAGNSLDAELVRVLKGMTAWMPAIEDGNASSATVVLPFKASLK